MAMLTGFRHMVQSESMKQEYTYTIQVHPAEEGEKGFWVSVPALPGCFSRGETYDEAVASSREAIELYLEGLQERGEPIPVERQPVVTHVNVALQTV
jgi:predicted RNase H-like HicB family nuclease